ncbi:MAG TPA: prephenate dehydratase domain-containing protein [Solirubrobacteraceae bacterium]|nr:prephenate dehydratase domain-containing protein [Solirubrobacteraceae bacterium]
MLGEPAHPMRVAYFGPEGTFTQEALITATAGQDGLDLVSQPTIYDTVMAVHFGSAQRALVPIENSLEGSVNATLDALAMETEDVAILGEVVHPIRHCLIARTALELSDIETVVSHPQATAQCARFIRTRLPQARVLAGSSTAEAVRTVAEHEGAWAALGNRLAAERYRCQVLRAGVEDVPDNETRFVWLGPVGAAPGGIGRLGSGGAAIGGHSGGADSGGAHSGGADPIGPDPIGPWKTAVVFWGVGSESPGWLVRCLSEFASRDVNLTRIESRPRKQGLGRYMFFLDLEGRDIEPHVADALAGLRGHVQVLRVLGSFPAAVV